MIDEKAKQLVMWVEIYENLKNMFNEFKKSCTTLLEGGNPLHLRIETLNEISFKITAFDSAILVTFSMVFGIRDIPWGRIVFERRVETGENEKIWSFYFSKHGNLREDLSQLENLHYMLNPESTREILVNVLERFLELSYCRPLEEMEGM
jgi:hypothetical protein